MRESKPVTNIAVGQLPFSCVYLCTCHVSDTIIVVYIKLRVEYTECLSTERPIGNSHDDENDPLFSHKSHHFLFIYSDRFSQLFFVVSAFSQKGQTIAVESPIIRNLSS